jgi:hypothetical protein
MSDFRTVHSGGDGGFGFENFMRINEWQPEERLAEAYLILNSLSL